VLWNRVPGDTDRCERCLLQRRFCVCADIPRIETRTRVLIVRHVSERTRSSNTGRAAALALARAEILDVGEQGVPFDGAALRRPGTWLVYPEGAPRLEAPAPPPEQIVVLDGTWQQARKMRTRLTALRGLPILRLPDAAAPRQRLRAAPAHGMVSTIEAIARALRLVEGEAPAAALEALFELLVARAHGSGKPFHT
jgi:DTW domain-containing protein YfiP